jgi:GNAT superfamily N-acetyltransferase
MTPDDAFIRPARRAEKGELEALMVAAYAQYQDEVPSPLFRAYVDDLRDLSGDWDTAEVMVAELDGRIVGGVLFFPDASAEGLGLPAQWAGFRKLAVHPAGRGRSVGRRLVESCVAKAERQGAPALAIHTAAFMRAACRIYERIGFQRAPEFDLKASGILGVSAAGDVDVIAYRMDLGRG